MNRQPVEQVVTRLRRRAQFKLRMSTVCRDSGFTEQAVRLASEARQCLHDARTAEQYAQRRG